jgi:hypothetical protein
MRLEYLPDGSPDCPLIRLFDFTPAEAARLGTAVTDLAAGRVEQVAVHDLLGVVPLGGCKLVLRRRSWDQALVRVGPCAFECGFTAGAWDNVAGLVEPFAAGNSGFQWLAGIPGEAALLLSVGGGW